MGDRIDPDAPRNFKELDDIQSAFAGFIPRYKGLVLSKLLGQGLLRQPRGLAGIPKTFTEERMSGGMYRLEHSRRRLVFALASLMLFLDYAKSRYTNSKDARVIVTNELENGLSGIGGARVFRFEAFRNSN